MEVGEYTSSDLPPFRFESYGDNLARCYRYFYPVVAAGAGGFVASGYYHTSTMVKLVTRLPVTMRAAPSLVQSVSTDGLRFYSNNGYDGLSQNFVIDGGARPEYVSWYNGTDASGTSGSAGQLYLLTTSNYIWFNAEL